MAVDSVPDYKTRASLPPIPGLRFRHFAGPSDYPAMNDVANNAKAANGNRFITPLDGFSGFYDSFEPEHCDKARDLIVVEVDGRIVGYARTEWTDDPDGTRFHQVFGFLDPAWRRRGIGRAMQAALEARALEALDEHPTADEAFFQADLSDADPGATAIVTQAGFVPVRFGYVMVRPSLDVVPDAPLPDGLEIRPVEEAHLPPIWDAAVEAWRDEWGFREPSERDYELFRTEPIQSDRSLWRVAWDGDEIAGQGARVHQRRRERTVRREARLGRERLRPPAVAQARPRPGADRLDDRRVARARHDRGRPRRRHPEPQRRAPPLREPRVPPGEQLDALAQADAPGLNGLSRSSPGTGTSASQPRTCRP